MDTRETKQHASWLSLLVRVLLPTGLFAIGVLSSPFYRVDSLRAHLPAPGVYTYRTSGGARKGVRSSTELSIDARSELAST